MDNEIVVLAGGLSHERDVSLRSGRRVATALRALGHEVIEADVSAEMVSMLQGLRAPVVFSMLHGGVGEDGALPEVLTLLGVPYVGTAGSSCRIAFDKSIATAVAAQAGARVPRQVALPHDIFRELGAARLVEALAYDIGFPMMIKPACSGSSLGASRVNDVSEVPQAMVAAYAYGALAVVEEFVEGTELALTLIDTPDGVQALPLVEIRASSGVYDFESRYTAGATRFLVPADIDDARAQSCIDSGMAIHRALGLAGIVRIDMILPESGAAYFLEANVAPGMTETSLAPLAIEAAGLTMGEVCESLVTAAVSSQ